MDQNRVVMSHGKASNTHSETLHLQIEVKPIRIQNNTIKPKSPSSLIKP